MFELADIGCLEADQIGGSARGYLASFASLPAGLWLSSIGPTRISIQHCSRDGRPHLANRRPCGVKILVSAVGGTSAMLMPGGRVAVRACRDVFW